MLGHSTRRKMSNLHAARRFRLKKQSERQQIDMVNTSCQKTVADLQRDKFWTHLSPSRLNFLNFHAVVRKVWPNNGLFLPTDSDSKPYRYIVLCTTFSTGPNSDSDPCMVTVPILGTDLCPRDRSPSLFHTFESGIKGRIRTSGKILHSTGIRVRIRLRQWK